MQNVRLLARGLSVSSLSPSIRRQYSWTTRSSAAILFPQTSHHRSESTAAIPSPTLEGEEKNYAPKIRKLVEDISKLTLLEVADLNELLKKSLNIADTPMMMPMGGMSGGGKAQAAEEEVETKVEKTLFTVRLIKFDEAKKVALIKEVKNHIAGMNLVQAKKYVESLPQTVMTDVSKEEAEKLKAALTAVGATVEVD